MEVLDDMKLGKIIKAGWFPVRRWRRAGFRVSTLHSGLGNIVSGVTKNFLPPRDFDCRSLRCSCSESFAQILCRSCVAVAHGWMLGFVAVSLTNHPRFPRWLRRWSCGLRRWYALTQPIGAAIFAYMLLRSTVVTLRQGRNCVAGDVLSTGEIAARIGVRRSTPAMLCHKVQRRRGFSFSYSAGVCWMRVRGRKFRATS